VVFLSAWSSSCRSSIGGSILQTQPCCNWRKQRRFLRASKRRYSPSPFQQRSSNAIELEFCRMRKMTYASMCLLFSYFLKTRIFTCCFLHFFQTFTRHQPPPRILIQGGSVRQGRIVTGSVFVVDKPALNTQLAECGLGAPEAVEVRYSVFFYVPSLSCACLPNALPYQEVEPR